MAAAFLIVMLTGRVLNAHEISPSISDLTINDDTVNFELRLNIESFVARIDLQSITNTDDTEAGKDYDRFRSMAPEVLESTFREF